MNILFQGDSITDAGRNRTISEPNIGLGNGYVNLICAELTGTHPDAGYNIYNRAMGGNRISDMYGRWIEDAINPEYELLSILCGINDVGFAQRLQRGSNAERFEFIYDQMLDEVRQSHPNARIVLIAPFVFRFRFQDGIGGEDIYNDWDIWSGEIRKRGCIAQRLAEKYNGLFLPMFDVFSDLCTRYAPQTFSVDCIHLKPAGNYVLARHWIDLLTENHYL